MYWYIAVPEASAVGFRASVLVLVKKLEHWLEMLVTGDPRAAYDSKVKLDAGCKSC